MATIPEIYSQAFQLQNAGNLRQAEQLYRLVLAADPNHAHAWNNLGLLAKETGRPEEAIEYLRRALALLPDLAAFHWNLAVAYRTAHDVPAAVTASREALRLEPGSAPFHIYLAEVLLELGQIDEAMALAREALRLHPGFPPAYSMLGELAVHGRYCFSGEDIRQMEAMIEGGRLSSEHASLLHFTLAGCWERQGDYDRAFHSYGLANERKREVFRKTGRGFDRQAFLAGIDSLIASFTPEFFQRARSFGVDSERPIFVVGMVRSGTSLVEQILGSHPQVFGCGELKDIERISTTFYPACKTGMARRTIQTLANRYLQRVERLSGAEAVRVIDKMTHNFLHLGLIAVLFPQARIVHCRRDPLDVCVSAYLQNFADVPYATSLEDVEFYYRQYERLMEHWRRVLPLRMQEVVYEELVAEQERISREMVAFCGLAWDERCLAFHTNPRAVRTTSKLQVRQPMYRHSVARWQRFNAHLQPLREALAGP